MRIQQFRLERIILWLDVYCKRLCKFLNTLRKRTPTRQGTASCTHKDKFITQIHWTLVPSSIGKYGGISQKKKEKKEAGRRMETQGDENSITTVVGAPWPFGISEEAPLAPRG